MAHSDISFASALSVPCLAEACIAVRKSAGLKVLRLVSKNVMGTLLQSITKYTLRLQLGSNRTAPPEFVDAIGLVITTCLSSLKIIIVTGEFRALL